MVYIKFMQKYITTTTTTSSSTNIQSNFATRPVLSSPFTQLTQPTTWTRILSICASVSVSAIYLCKSRRWFSSRTYISVLSTHTTFNIVYNSSRAVKTTRSGDPLHPSRSCLALRLPSTLLAYMVPYQREQVHAKLQHQFLYMYLLIHHTMWANNTASSSRIYEYEYSRPTISRTYRRYSRYYEDHTAPPGTGSFILFSTYTRSKLSIENIKETLI